MFLVKLLGKVYFPLALILSVYCRFQYVSHAEWEVTERPWKQGSEFWLISGLLVFCLKDPIKNFEINTRPVVEGEIDD